jgi:hypothetical protein
MKKIIVILLMFAQPIIVHAELCKLKGADVAEYAYQNGFVFRSQGSHNTSCTLSKHRAGGTAASKVGGQCTFFLFFEDKLVSPWKFSDIHFSGDRFRIVSEPDEGSDHVKTELTLLPSQSETAWFLVSHIDLEGPDCGSWKSAF